MENVSSMEESIADYRQIRRIYVNRVSDVDARLCGLTVRGVAGRRPGRDGGGEIFAKDPDDTQERR